MWLAAISTRPPWILPPVIPMTGAAFLYARGFCLGFHRSRCCGQFHFEMGSQPPLVRRREDPFPRDSQLGFCYDLV
jgi:hypothetical protein